MLVIPNLSELPFHRVEVVLSVTVDQLDDADRAGLSYMWDELKEGAYRTELSGPRTTYATCEIGGTGFDGETTGTANAALSLSFDPPDPFSSPTSGDGRFMGPHKWKKCDPQDIWSNLDFLLSRTVDLFLKVSYTISRDELALDSLVASMIGLRTKAGEEQFLLSGAQFAIRGFPDDTISWYLIPGSNGQNIGGDVSRSWVEQFHPESISDAIQVLEDRFHRVVRAQSSVKIHANS